MVERAVDTDSSVVRRILWGAMKPLNEQFNQHGTHVRVIYEMIEGKASPGKYIMKATTYISKVPKEGVDYSTLTLRECEVSDEPFDNEMYRIEYTTATRTYEFEKMDTMRVTPQEFLRSLLLSDNPDLDFLNDAYAQDS